MNKGSLNRKQTRPHFIIFFFRDGRVRVGDEIINVCGRRLRGLCIDEAIKALKMPKRELDIVVARDQTEKQPNELFAAFLDEDRLRDEHLRIAQKIHDYQETCSEVNLSSRSSSSKNNGKSKQV